MKNKKDRKPTTIYGAACEVVNSIINEATKFEGLGFLKEKVFIALSNRKYITDVVNSSYGTIDGESDDILMLINLSKYIIDYHIERNDLHIIEYVKVKNYPDGSQGWTSVHYPT